MSTTIWALAVGEYSDYRIKALFTSEHAAEQAIKAHKGDDEWTGYDDARVEAFTLYDAVPEPVTSYFMQGVIWDNGTAGKEELRVESKLPWNHLWGMPPQRPDVRFIRAPMYRDKGGRLEVYGSDEQSVRQAFGDRKARILAELQGIV